MIVQLLIFLITFLLLMKFFKNPSNYPPGPKGLPIIGSIPRSTSALEKRIDELRKQHGDILSWRLGGRVVIILCNYKLIKEAFLVHFADRPEMRMVTILEPEKTLGMLGTSGAHWQALRRFSVRYLKDLGMGKSQLLGSIHFEALELVKELKKQSGKAAPLPYAITVAVLNVFWLMVAGKRYDLKSSKIKMLEEMMREVLISNAKRVSIGDFFPWIQKLLPKFVYNYLVMKDQQNELASKLRAFFEEDIVEHQKTLDKSNIRDYIDAYLIEMDNTKSNPDSTMSIEDLRYTIADLFAAGTETTKTAINYSIYYMIAFPNVQKRLQEENGEVLLKGSLPTLEDKAKLPYLDAFIQEMFRYSSFIPFGLPHTAPSDITFKGYFLPKGTLIIPSMKSVHFDPNIFQSPNEFRPERFLDHNGKFLNTKEGLIPFIIGRRQCPGESLARMELFIFLSALIQNFSFSVPPGKQIDLNPIDCPLVKFPNLQQDVIITTR